MGVHLFLQGSSWAWQGNERVSERFRIRVPSCPPAALEERGASWGQSDALGYGSWTPLVLP